MRTNKLVWVVMVRSYSLRSKGERELDLCGVQIFDQNVRFCLVVAVAAVVREEQKAGSGGHLHGRPESILRIRWAFSLVAAAAARNAPTEH